MSEYEVLVKAADMVAARLGRAPIGVVLGSGLSEAFEGLGGARYLDYREIPGLPDTSVSGHRGALLHGHAGRVPLLVACGRVHMYEGLTAPEIAATARLLSFLGVHSLIVTSTVASTTEDLPPGRVMLVEDHINLSGTNVLASAHDPRFGPRFPDRADFYDRSLQDALGAAAASVGIPITTGVLAQLLGPGFGTRAEVAMVARQGASVISMSMVPEVVAARQRGMRVAGLACVTSLAAGLGPDRFVHEDFLARSAALVETVETLVGGALPRIAGPTPVGGTP